MNYYGIFEHALRKLNLSKKDVKEWKPAGDIYVPEIGEIKDTVVIWTNDGREILFREKGTKRFIEVDTRDTIGDFISRIFMSVKVDTSKEEMVQFRIPMKIWKSSIPAHMLYPEGSDYE